MSQRRSMLKQVCLVCLLGISCVVSAGTNKEVSKVNCRGSWIKQGTDKFSVLDACGEPLYSDVISGANRSKVEKLMFKIGQRRYVFFIESGEVEKIEMLRH